MDALVSRASMIWVSLHPSPASETSAFNKIRAFISRCAGLFPFRISVASCSRSSSLSRTTYFFTIISFAAMIASVVRVAIKSNHQILSDWLKRTTSRRLSQIASQSKESLPQKTIPTQDCFSLVTEHKRAQRVGGGPILGPGEDHS